jgi:hypothetical protein
MSLLTNAMLRDVLVSSLLRPAAVAMAVLAGVLFAGGRRSAASGAPVAFACGFTLAVFPDVLPLKPSQSAWHWLPLAALVALVVGVLARSLPWLLARTLLAAVAAGLAAWLLVPHHVPARAWVLPILGLIIFALWQILERLARTTPGGQAPWLLALTFLAGGLIILYAHCGRLAEVAMICAGALIGLGLVACWARIDCSGVVPATAVLLPGTLLAGATETWSEVPGLAFALVALAPLVLAGTLPTSLRRWPLTRLALLRLLLLLLPLACAVLLAVHAESIDL